MEKMGEKRERNGGRKISVLGRTARVVQFVCIIPVITQTIATV